MKIDQLYVDELVLSIFLYNSIFSNLPNIHLKKNHIDKYQIGYHFLTTPSQRGGSHIELVYYINLVQLMKFFKNLKIIDSTYSRIFLNLKIDSKYSQSSPILNH